MTPPPGWQPAPHRIQARQRRAVLRGARHRAHHEELVEGQLGVVPMAAADAELPLDVDAASAARARDDARAQPRRVRSERIDAQVDEALALAVPSRP